MLKLEWNVKWDRKRNAQNREYELCLLPFWGIAIGFLMYLFSMFCQHFGFGQPSFALMGTVFPVLASGGSAIAGFAGTAEALVGRKTQEQRLAQVRKGQTGIYAVLAIFCYFMLYAGSLILIWKKSQLFLLWVGYLISRILSSMAWVWFPCAKGETEPFGQKQKTQKEKAQKQNIRVILITMTGLCFVVCLMVSPILGVLQILAGMWAWTYYFYMSKKAFGGITKETNGFFQTLCELVMVLVIGILGRIG